MGIRNFLMRNHQGTKLLVTILMLLAIILIVKLLIKTTHNLIEDANRYYRTRKTIYFIASLAFFIFLFFIWFEDAGNFTTYLGLVSAGIAVALKDFFGNIAAWFFIVIKRPFRIGDRVTIQQKSGDVIDIRLFQFSLIEVSTAEDGEQSTGRIIDIPNHYVFLYPLTNAVKGFSYIWNEIKVEITFESNWEKAKKIFEEVLYKHTHHFAEEAEKEVIQASKRFVIYYNIYTPIVYTDVSASGVVLTLRYLCTPKDKRKTVNDIWEELLLIMHQDEEIDLAYPTRRVVN